MKRVASRGAAVLEMALVVPIVLAFVFGIVDVAYLVFAHETVDHAGADSARVASVAGRAPDADWQVLQRVKLRTVGLRRASLERVVIYRATSVSDSAPASCTGGTAGPTCSVYGPADIDRAASALVCGWCPADRAPGDYIGVWISYRQESLTGIFGSRRIVEQTILASEYPT